MITSVKPVSTLRTCLRPGYLTNCINLLVLKMGAGFAIHEGAGMATSLHDVVDYVPTSR
jgi:hypothetical protein